MDHISREIGINLKRYRTVKGYTQEELAELAGVSVSYISQLENGLKTPSVSLIAKLSELLNLNGAMMLIGDGELQEDLKDLIQLLINKEPEDIHFIKKFSEFYLNNK